MVGCKCGSYKAGTSTLLPQGHGRHYCQAFAPSSNPPSAFRARGKALHDLSHDSKGPYQNRGVIDSIERALYEEYQRGRADGALDGADIQELLADGGASADDLREAGYSVAVHNDYRLDGKFHTFWLLTKDRKCYKGEGTSDTMALNQIREQVGMKEKSQA